MIERESWTSNKTKAMLGVFLSSFMFSTGGVLVKLIPGNPLAISAWRSIIALPIMLAFLGRPRFNWSFEQIGAALGFAGVIVGFVVATKLTTAANAIVLQYTSPIFVAILARWLLQERTTRLDRLTIIVVFAGLVLFFFDKIAFRGLVGNLIAVGTGISFAFMLVLLRKQRHGGSLESIVLGNIITILVCVPFVFTTSINRSGWLWVFLLGAVQQGLALILYTRAIRGVTALEVVIIKGIEPILNPIWVYLLVGEKPGPWALVGAAIVFVAVTCRSILSALRSTQEPAATP